MTDSFPSTGQIRVAVITGQHAFDVPHFQALFRALPEVDAYPQELENWAADEGHVRTQYDVLLFYNFHQETPGQGGNRWAPHIQVALAELGGTPQGIVVLHHGLLAFREWPLWSEVVGIRDRGFGYHPGQTLRVEVAAEAHPITHGLAPWEMVDETYTIADATTGSTTLLTTEHPRSMRTLAWVRSYRQARVLCLALGHDDHAFGNPQFRRVLQRGIHWAARRI